MNGFLLTLSLVFFIVGLLDSLRIKAYATALLCAGLACWVGEVLHVYFQTHH